MAKAIFQYQIYHLLCVIILIAGTQMFMGGNDTTTHGALWHISTRAWFWIAILIPVLHQIYVWIIWRLELYHKTFTSRYGLSKAFKLYAAGFSLLFVSRLISIVFLAVSNQNSLAIDPVFPYLLAGTITPVVLYLFYSVKKYFTLERAYGMDHFDNKYKEPFVKKGIFRITNNGMYVYGFMILYVPGLLLLSKAALAAALLNHIYIWVHYFCTERPDMKVIYGRTPGR